ncbi:phosphoethanolamine transferase [Komagataeibacter melomenusus]
MSEEDALIKKFIFLLNKNKSDALFWLWLLLPLMACFRGVHPIQRSLFILIPIMAIINRKSVLLFLSTILIFILPGALFYEGISGISPGTDLWLILFYCSVPVAFGYVKSVILYIIIWCIVCISIGYLCIWVSWGKGPIFRSKILRILLCLPLIFPIIKIHKNKTNFFHEVFYTPYGDINKYFSNLFPWSIFSGYLDAKFEVARITKEEENLNHASLHITYPEKYQNNHTVVLVLGESGRRDHHHLFGYKVPDTPMLDQEKDLLAFSDMITPFDYTIGSVPVILSRYDRVMDHSILHPDLMTIFNAAGYETYWISNHPRLGPYDSMVSLFAFHAKHSKYVTEGNGVMSRPHLDGEMLPYVEKAMKEQVGNKLIVVHIYGSHELSSDRYPSSFSRFDDPYDNSILYSDYIISQVLDMARAQKGETTFFYVSDHGLRVNECVPGTYHGDIRQSYEVPFLAWFSPEWIDKHPAEYAAAKSHLNTPMTTHVLSDTIADSADLRFSDFDPALSIFSQSLKSSTRVIHSDQSSSVIDYDHSHNSLTCHVMADDNASR